MFSLSLFSPDGSLDFEHYRRLLVEARQREMLMTSLLLGSGTAALATLIGAPLGLLLARVRAPGKAWCRLALVIPLVVPPYILALAWTWLGLSAGLTYSLGGAVIVLGASFYPLAMLATEAAARRVDAGLEEAALLVAGPRRVYAKITLPLVAPAVSAAALLIFVLATAEFGVPGLLRVNVFTTEIFTAFAAFYDFGTATALAAPLLVMTLVAGILARVIVGESLLASRRGTRTGMTTESAGWRALAATSIASIVAACVVAPFAVLAAEAGEIDRIFSAVRESGGAIANSLALATVSATLITALALLLGYGRARMRSRWRGLVDLGFILAFAVPGTVIGVGLIGLWNRPGMAGAIYASPMIIVIACMARFTPVAALMLAAGARQIPVSYEEAAEASGASWPRIFTRIFAPQMAASLGAAWVVSFIFAFGELGTALLVAPPGESTLPVRIYTMIANAPASAVASLALMQTMIVLLSLAVLMAIAGRRGGNN
jgi:iron(III) transport system permease protein